MCENGSSAVSLHVYKKAHAHKCYTVYMITRMTLRGSDSHVLQPTAKITLGSFDIGDSSTLTNTHLASSVSVFQ